MNVPTQTAIQAFVDLRSPYSYLALKPARALARRKDVIFDWFPFITDFHAAYGGEIDKRTSRDVAKLKYLYMDCRRLAELQGLTVRSTIKLWDASLVSKAFLFAKAHGRLWEFCDPMLVAFWRREFDLESQDALEAALVEAGLQKSEWRKYLRDAGQRDLDAALTYAEQLKVFGAPTFVYQDEPFWGSDRLDLLENRLSRDGNTRRPSDNYHDR